MLITFNEIHKILLENNIKITGAFHIGAHDCEELVFYNQCSISEEDIIWIDALESKVVENIEKGIKNIYHATITDKDNEDIVFNVSNNIQSSSVLEFGTHLQEHPGVVFIDKISQKSITIDTFFEKNNIDRSKYNFWNFDIQGAELLALKGAINSIKHVDAIYLEVNEKELYKDCGLITDIDLFLSQYNFKRVITNMTQYGWGDALYIKSKTIEPKKYITFQKLGRTGNNLFQYMFCKLISIRSDYEYVYIPLEEIDNNFSKIFVYEDDLETILTREVSNNSILICEGFFQKSEYYFEYRDQLLDILYTTEEYYYIDGHKIYIKDFINSINNTPIQENDIVLHIRLDDFRHYGSRSTTDIIPQLYYNNLLENWNNYSEHPFNKLYIVCDKLRYDWEKTYFKAFDKWEPILIQNSLMDDVAIMRDCPILLHSNSTLCWFISFISKSKKIRIIPNTNFYPTQMLTKIENSDIVIDVLPLQHHEIGI